MVVAKHRFEYGFYRMIVKMAATHRRKKASRPGHPFFLQFLPAQVLSDGMHQRQAEVAARDFRYRAGGRLQDAQAIAVPGCRIGFVNADRGWSPPPEWHKESASEETLKGLYSSRQSGIVYLFRMQL